MESNQMLELRYKRLNYYNKLISNESPPATAEAISSTATNNNSNEILSFEPAPINFIDNFFGSTPNPNNTNQIYNNKKLEEFKKVVESSYNIHVIKKSDQLVKSSVESVIPNKNIFTNQLSLSDSLPNSSRADQETTSYRSNDTMNSTTLTCKIPYMSAYNIYNEEKSNNNLIRRMSDSTTQEAYIEKFNSNNQDNNQLILQTMRKMSISSNEEQQLKHKQQINVTTTLEKKLSSNGSSLNTSPTSQSSSSSSLVNNNVLQQQQPAIQVKPPDKPRTQSVASYRKNLLKLSMDSNKADQSKSLDLNKQTNHESIKLSDSLEISPKPTYTRDNFFNNLPTNKAIKIKKSKTKSIKKQKNSIFNFVNDYDDEQEEKAKAEDNFSDEDKNDTFDIFSSEENLEKTIQENFTSNNKDIDLKIDLGCLSDQHDEEEHENINKKSKINFADFNDDDEDYSIIIENDKLTSNRITSGRQNQLQTKPENIPNLMLDLIDDEKSTQSVTASLAKSMCKEIDYQKEMEILYTLGSKNTAEPIQQSVLKSQRDQRLLTNIKKNNNFKKPTNPTNFTSQLNSLAVPNKIKTQVPEYFKVDLTKPPPQPRASSALSARNLITTTAHAKIIKQEYVRPESAASGSFVHNYDRNKSRIKLNRIDLTNQNNNNNNETPSKFNQIKKTKNFLSVSKDFKNQNKPSLAKNRPSSAMSNPKYSDISDSEMTVPDPPNRSKLSLFFDYSKLISIETNLKQEEEEEEKPQLTSEFLNTLGDQDAYKQIFLNNENEIESKFEARWLELPDEIWLRILKTLPHKDLVQFGACCKKFKNLYLDNSLWRKIKMKYKYDVKGEWLEWIGKRRPNELNIVQCNGNLSLNSIVEMFRMIGDELQVLNLSRCSNVSLSGDNFALQASIRCPNITNLDLSWTLLSNQTLKLIADSFRKIESINLSGCSMIGEDGFNCLITKHGEWLKNLEISGCIHFSSNCVLNIGAYCRGLERLNISNCHRMTNESIMEACPQWLKLKFLDLRGIKTIKNNCVSTIVRRCNRIESLALGECIQLSDACMLEIATYKPNIKYLDINGCKKITDNSIRSLANFCVKLEFLNLRATNITDIGLITLINGKCIKTLEDLNLSYLPVSEAILIKLLKNQTNLKRIHLYGCYNIKKLDEIKKLTASENKVIFNI